MKKFTFILLLFCTGTSLEAQFAADAAVQLTAIVQNSPAQITLSWVGNASTSQYQVFRKLKGDAFWGTAIATLSGSTNQFIDNTVNTGISYEYFVQRTGSSYTGYGYINSGIDLPEVNYRGKLILMVDSNFIGTLSNELDRLVYDIEGDGWEVIRHDVLRTGSVTHIKELIANDYYLDTANTKAVFLFGHIPVPYSGNLNPDGHSDHLGAWPADCYYADVDGIWTDAFVTSTTVSPARTQNVPGDGKFDQSTSPTPLELQVGRVDFNAMSTFSLTEEQLLKNYLDKDHDYRKKIFVPIKQGVIDDNFGYFSGEAFAASGYKNLAPLVGSSSVTAADYFTSMSGNSYLWSYGCGGGSYTSAGGIGNTSNFASANLQGVFTMLFGSYFGDWDSNNNFLRAALAQGKVLTNVWSGRPHYQFHHMALGENIGYSLLQTQNNTGGVYFSSVTGITGRWVQNALMGDPTLRNDVVAPVSNVVATKTGYDCVINWTASSETGLSGYNIYMKNDSNTTYIKLNSTPISGTSYTDVCLSYGGIYSYMIRAIKLETTPSGSYYNLSEGIADTALNSTNIKTHAAFSSTLTGVTLDLTNNSVNAASSFWNFGNGQTSTQANPSVTFTANNVYLVTLISTNGCDTDTAFEVINITEVGIDELSERYSLLVYPNPSEGSFTIRSDYSGEMQVEIINLEGKTVAGYQNVPSNKCLEFSNVTKGLYFIKIHIEDKFITRTIAFQ